MYNLRFSSHQNIKTQTNKNLSSTISQVSFPYPTSNIYNRHKLSNLVERFLCKDIIEVFKVEFSVIIHVILQQNVGKLIISDDTTNEEFFTFELVAAKGAIR